MNIDLTYFNLKYAIVNYNTFIHIKQTYLKVFKHFINNHILETTSVVDNKRKTSKKTIVDRYKIKIKEHIIVKTIHSSCRRSSIIC